MIALHKVDIIPKEHPRGTALKEHPKGTSKRNRFKRTSKRNIPEEPPQKNIPKEHHIGAATKKTPQRNIPQGTVPTGHEKNLLRSHSKNH